MSIYLLWPFKKMSNYCKEKFPSAALKCAATVCTVYIFTILDKTIHVVLNSNLGILGIILKFDTITSCDCDVKRRIKVEK